MFKARNFKSHGLPPFRSLKSLGQPLPLRSHAPQPRDSATLRSSLVTPTLPSTTMTSATGRPVTGGGRRFVMNSPGPPMCEELSHLSQYVMVEVLYCCIIRVCLFGFQGFRIIPGTHSVAYCRPEFGTPLCCKRGPGRDLLVRPFSPSRCSAGLAQGHINLELDLILKGHRFLKHRHPEWSRENRTSERKGRTGEEERPSGRLHPKDWSAIDAMKPIPRNSSWSVRVPPPLRFGCPLVSVKPVDEELEEKQCSQSRPWKNSNHKTGIYSWIFTKKERVSGRETPGHFPQCHSYSRPHLHLVHY